MSASRVSLFLVIILWGTLLGASTYEHIGFFSVFLSALPDSAVVVNGPHGIDNGRFWVLIHPILILSLLSTLGLNWKASERRKLILTSIAIYALALLVTFWYFVSELMAFADSPNSTVSAEEWRARGDRWQYLSWLRALAMYAGLLPLLIALTKPAREVEVEETS